MFIGATSFVFLIVLYFRAATDILLERWDEAILNKIQPVLGKTVTSIEVLWWPFMRQISTSGLLSKTPATKAASKVLGRMRRHKICSREGGNGESYIPSETREETFRLFKILPPFCASVYKQGNPPFS